MWLIIGAPHAEHMITRRALLKSIGIAGGAGMMFESMQALGLTAPAIAAADYQAPARGGGHTKVVILGAGIAGLATAYELGKAGYNCTILEAKNRVGGRNWTVRGGTTETDLDGYKQTARFSEGQYLNAGPARLPQSHITLDYCRELGVEVQPFLNQNANALLYYDGKAPVRYRTAKADVYGYVSELLSKAIDQGALDKELTADDKEQLLTFLEDFGDIGGKADGFAYTGSSRRGYSVEPGAGDTPGVVLGPPPSLSEVIASRLGRTFTFELEYDQAITMMQPVGGMDAIPMALYRAIGTHKVRLGAEVTRVTNHANGVEVAYRDATGERTISADYCVAALPPHIMARVPTNLGDAVTAALKTPTLTPVGKIGLEYRSRWWEAEDRIYGGITETDLDLTHVWYPSYGFHGKRGTIVGYYNTGANARTYGSLTPGQRVERALAQGAKIHGDRYRTELANAFSVAWHRTPYVEAGWVGWPSRTTGEYELLNQPQGRVYFAGDWLTYWIAWQNGAFDSARKVVTALHSRVQAGG